MNKTHTSKLREKSRIAAQPLRSVIGTVEDIELSRRRLNRNRKAVFEFTLVTTSTGKKLTVFVPYALRHRCIRELLCGEVLEMQLQKFSYCNNAREFELLDFRKAG